MIKQMITLTLLVVLSSVNAEQRTLRRRLVQGQDLATRLNNLSLKSDDASVRHEIPKRTVESRSGKGWARPSPLKIKNKAHRSRQAAEQRAIKGRAQAAPISKGNSLTERRRSQGSNSKSTQVRDSSALKLQETHETKIVNQQLQQKSVCSQSSDKANGRSVTSKLPETHVTAGPKTEALKDNAKKINLVWIKRKSKYQTEKRSNGRRTEIERLFKAKQAFHERYDKNMTPCGLFRIGGKARVKQTRDIVDVINFRYGSWKPSNVYVTVKNSSGELSEHRNTKLERLSSSEEQQIFTSQWQKVKAQEKKDKPKLEENRDVAEARLLKERFGTERAKVHIRTQGEQASNSKKRKGAILKCLAAKSRKVRRERMSENDETSEESLFLSEADMKEVNRTTKPEMHHVTIKASDVSKTSRFKGKSNTNG